MRYRFPHSSECVAVGLFGIVAKFLHNQCPTVRQNLQHDEPVQRALVGRVAVGAAFEVVVREVPCSDLVMRSDPPPKYFRILEVT